MTPPVRRTPVRNRALLTAADLAHARTATYRRHLDDARRILSELPDKCAAAISWGKDSIVLVDLLQRERPDITLVHLRNHGPERPPGLDETRDSAIKRWDLHPHLPSWEPVAERAREIGLPLSRAHQGWTPALCRKTSGPSPPRPNPGETQAAGPASPGPRPRPLRPSSDPPRPQVSQRARTCYLEVPCETPVHAWIEARSVFAEPQTAIQAEALRAVTSRNFSRWRDAITKEVRATHVCGALRARESNRRLFAILQHGTTWQPAKHRKWDIPTTHPLAWWTSQDVWGHIALHDLPLPRHYRWAAEHGWDRDRVRSEPGFRPIEWDASQAAFWAQAEPEMWRRLHRTVPGFHPDLLLGKRRTTRGTTTIPRLKAAQQRLDGAHHHGRGTTPAAPRPGDATASRPHRSSPQRA